MRMNSRLNYWCVSIVISTLFASVLPALAWGPEGHRAVAIIAEKNLKPDTLSAIRSLLGPYDTLAAESVWADDIREEHPETGPWHYIDIPLSVSSIDMARDCRDANCVVGKIQEFESVLKNKSADQATRRDALKFLVHFVGDLHQPLHCEDNGDKGGNTIQVIFFGQPMNLHSAWDGGIFRREKLFGLKLATELEGRITSDEKAAWVHGTVADWAMEGHTLAVQVAYGKLPHEATPNLGEEYFNAALPIVELQIKKAGIRLAAVLNQALP